MSDQLSDQLNPNYPDAEAAAQDHSDDPVFRAEQEHLAELYQELERLRDKLREDVESNHFGAAQDLIDMSEEVALNFSGYDEALETYAAIETLNSVIDAYNLYHDANVDKLRRVALLLAQPYFAKVTLEMRPGQPPRDVYIGAAGITDDNRRPLVVDWRSPVAETYYNQEMGRTSYKVNGRTRTVNLMLRRQFDLTRNKLNAYFDTTVAIEDSLLLAALSRHHSEKLQAITATIQREQNEVVRHEDVPVLLVNGIAGSGKTSVLLQRIAFLLYRERETLTPDQVWLFTPNRVFENYIDTVEAAVPGMALEPDDLRDIRLGEEIILKVSQVRSAVERCARFCAETGFGIGPRFTTLAKEALLEKLEKRFAQMARNEELQESIAAMDVEEQIELFGQTVASDDDKDLERLARQLVEMRYGTVREQIENLSWLRFDRIGMRLLGRPSVNATEWLYLKLLFSGSGDEAARYVMVDEVQDYTEAQLMVLARYFSHAHFMLLGDEHQAIFEGTASFARAAEIFRASHGHVDECRLLTSYRSSPEITALFTGLLDEREQLKLTSVQRAGVEPVVQAFDSTDAYLEALRGAVAAHGEGLCAVIAESDARVSWLAKQLGDAALVVDKNTHLPAEGVVLLPLRTAKGLEFDQVIIPDAQEEVYPDTPLARRRLYTALSRAMHQVTVLAQGPLTPLLG